MFERAGEGHLMVVGPLLEEGKLHSTVMRYGALTPCPT